MCLRGPACVRVDTCVSIVMELIECNDDVNTTQRSARVDNIPHTQIKHVSICAEFFALSTTLRCSMQDSAGVMHGKGKERLYLYSAFIVATTLKALRRGSHSFTCK